MSMTLANLNEVAAVVNHRPVRHVLAHVDELDLVAAIVGNVPVTATPACDPGDVFLVHIV